MHHNNVFSVFNKQYQSDGLFHDTIETEPVKIRSPEEGFYFDGFTTMTHDWWLTKRDAPTPSEKEITYDVPYKQGVEDFSDMNGLRFFGMREITYELICLDHEYSFRREKAQYLKRALMSTGGYHELDDTDHPGFCFNAKCTSVSIDDNTGDGVITATVKFSAYPYAIARSYEGSDIWDEVEFDHWCWQDTVFTGSSVFQVTNLGSKPVECHFKVTSNYTVTGDGINKPLEITPENQDIVSFALPVGEHGYRCSGDGTIEFVFKREEMI